MSVASIESSKSFKFHGPRAGTQPPERPVDDQPKPNLLTLADYFYIPLGILVTAWLPTGLWCAELQNPLPAFLVAITELIGSIIGIVTYRNGPPTPPPAVPANIWPDKHSAAASYRKAA